MHVDTNDRAYL